MPAYAAGYADRLARPPPIPTKRGRYAHEELVAELGASFVSGAIGIKLQARENHAALSVLLADRKMGKRLSGCDRGRLMLHRPWLKPPDGKGEHQRGIDPKRRRSADRTLTAAAILNMGIHDLLDLVFLPVSRSFAG